MRDIQISRPMLIALVGAVLVGGFLFFKQSSGGGEDLAPPAPAAAATAATGATGSSDATGATGSSKGKKAAKAAAAGSIASTKLVPTGSTGQMITRAQARQLKALEKKQKLIAAAEAAGMPVSVYQPLQDGKIVMIYFWNKKATDDDRVNNAILNLQKYRGSSLVVKRESINNKAKYTGIAKVAEITQTPGIVILYGSDADEWQGWIDSTALNARITRLTGNSGPGN